MKKIILLSFISIVIYTAVNAQNDVQLSQQIYNRNLFNPAATGQSGCWNVSTAFRQQWTGFTGRPSIQVLNVNKYLQGPKLGFGLSVINDKLGAERSQNVKAAIAYHAWLSEKAVLSFGLSVGVLNKTVNGSELIYENSEDPNAYVEKKSKLKPDFDFGLEFNLGGFNLGFASTHLITSLKKSETFKVPRHIYAYTKYAIKAGEKVEITPALSYQNIGKVHFIEANVTGMFLDRFWVGGAYRHGDAAVVLAGVKIIKQLSLGYSYDIPIGPVKGFSGGSHEIMLIGKFGNCDSFLGHIAPRFFN